MQQASSPANNVLHTRYLTRRGYVVRKESLDAGTLARIRKDLLVTPFNPVKQEMLRQQKKRDPSADVAADPDSFKVYLENAQKLYLPRYYAESLLGPPERNELTTAGEPLSPRVLFQGTLREPQMDVADRTVAHLEAKGGGLLQLRCGFGKTIIALHLVARLGLRTIVLVHKEFLMNQWKERIEQFLPAARVGTLQAKTVDVEGMDIVIGMLQSVATKSYGDVLERFGLAIFDECHHLGAAVFSRAMHLTRTRYMLGLSATPDRKDRLRKVFDWQLGEVICKVEASTGGAAQKDGVMVRTVRFDDPAVHQGPEATVVHLSSGEEGGLPRPVVYREVPALRAKLLTHLVESRERHALLLSLVMELVADPLRRVLVLSERRKHLETLGEALAANGVAHGFYWGGVRQSALEEAATKQVVLGTYHMASEGMDVPALNAVVLASPKSDVQQSVGRILRRTDHPVTPTIIDLLDARLPCFARQQRVRQKFYRECGFVIDGAKPCAAKKSAAHAQEGREEGNKQPSPPPPSSKLTQRKYAFRNTDPLQI